MFTFLEKQNIGFLCLWRYADPCTPKRVDLLHKVSQPGLDTPEEERKPGGTYIKFLLRFWSAVDGGTQDFYFMNCQKFKTSDFSTLTLPDTIDQDIWRMFSENTLCVTPSVLNAWRLADSKLSYHTFKGDITKEFFSSTPFGEDFLTRLSNNYKPICSRITDPILKTEETSTCVHRWVNVGFTSIKWVCAKCDMEKPAFLD